MKELYPLSYTDTFKQQFEKVKEAKDFCHDVNGVMINSKLVQWEGERSNVQTTGRAMYVIDNEGNVHKQILKLVRSIPFEGSYKLIGFTGIYLNRSNWNLDIYVSVTFDNTPFANQIISDLTTEGKKDYYTKMNQCRGSIAYINSLTSTDWDKAKQNGVI